MPVPGDPKLLNRLASVGGAALLLSLMIVLCGWTGPAGGWTGLHALRVMLTSMPIALAWLMAAIGLGWPLRAWLVAGSSDGLVLQAALGIALLLVLDAALGACGLLQGWGALGAWLLTGLGLAMALLQAASAIRKRRGRLALPSAAVWAGAPGAAVLLVAACSAPSWLWSSEFGGYDALSYHLQLPREWLALGHIARLEHNVYSFLPGYVEAAFYHLALLAGDGILAAYDAQFLHALVTLIAAWATSRCAGRLAGAPAGSATAAIFISTPWVVIVGSLAYNEMFTTLMLAAGLLLLMDEKRRTGWRAGLALGWLAGAACGAKLTSIGFVAAPLGALLLWRARPRLPVLAGALLAGAISVVPFLVANAVAVGNPVWPFLTSLFGAGHWTAEQVATWMRGHSFDGGFSARLFAAWNELLRYGLGPNPDPAGHEPWLPQWSLLPWAAALGLALALRDRALRRWAAALALVIGVQLAFWITATHLKSRFMLPAAAPLAVAAALGMARCRSRAERPRRSTDTTGDGDARPLVMPGVVIAALLLAHAALPVLLFRSERRSAPAAMIGRIGELTGDSLTPEVRAEAASLHPAIAMNWRLPDGSRTLLVGEAAPFYIRAPITYQTTWDRGPLSRLMREAPGEPAAWVAALQRMGFTHLLVDAAMLRRWERSGWNDPLLTARAVTEMAQRHARPVYRYGPGGDVVLYELPVPVP